MKTHYGTKFLNMEESFGLITFCVKDGEVCYLLYQRRDNYEYMDIIKGNWKDERHLSQLFSSISSEERERIRNYSFKELWDDLWINKRNKARYEQSLIRYKDAKKHIQNFFLKESALFDVECPWAFPKGKRKPQEEALACAVREFEEETHITTLDFRIWDGINYKEMYIGSDKKRYKSTYFVAESPDMEEPVPSCTPSCIRKTTITEESKDVKWLPFSEAYNILDSTKQNILKRIDFQIRKTILK